MVRRHKPSMINVDKLTISFPSQTGLLQVVRNVSFTIANEKLAIVGCSGSGKSLTAKALVGLVPKPAIVTAQVLSVFGCDVLTATNAQLRQLRGRKIAMIMQDPKFSLNPVLTIGEQIAESFRLHQGCARDKAKALTLNILDEVKIKDPAKVYACYPCQLSGGMGQRVMIAMMLACNPQLLVADEATSALDLATRDEILALLVDICKTKAMALLLISHDLPLVANYCDRVLVMNNGSIVDSGTANEFASSDNPYTKGLWQCLPSKAKKGQRLMEFTNDQNF